MLVKASMVCMKLAVHVSWMGWMLECKMKGVCRRRMWMVKLVNVCVCDGESRYDCDVVYVGYSQPLLWSVHHYMIYYCADGQGDIEGVYSNIDKETPIPTDRQVMSDLHAPRKA